MATLVLPDDDVDGRKLLAYSADWLIETAKRAGSAGSFDTKKFSDSFKAAFHNFEEDRGALAAVLMQSAIPTVFIAARKVTEPAERRQFVNQVELFFSGIIHTILGLGDQDAQRYIMDLADALFNAPKDASGTAADLQSSVDAVEIRLSTLILLANSLPPDSQTRFAVVAKAFELASAINAVSAVLPFARAIIRDSYSTSRQHIRRSEEHLPIAVEAYRDIRLRAAQILKAARDQEAALSAFEACLRDLQGEDPSSPAFRDPQVINAAVEVACATVRTPSRLFCDNLQQLTAVKALNDTEEHKKLAQLLDCVSSRGVGEFDAFASSNPGIFAKYQLDRAACRKKVLLLAVTDCLRDKEEEAIEDLARTLQVDSTIEAEALVVTAVGQQAVDARVDQERGVVTVKSCQPRKIEVEQWKNILTSLKALQASLETAEASWEVHKSEAPSTLPTGQQQQSPPVSQYQPYSQQEGGTGGRPYFRDRQERDRDRERAAQLARVSAPKDFGDLRQSQTTSPPGGAFLNRAMKAGQ